MAFIKAVTTVLLAAGLVQDVLAGSLALPSWPAPPAKLARRQCGVPRNLTVDVGYAVYKGVHNDTTKLNVWKGIRYAEPPVGDLRWREARIPTTNRTVVAADAFGSACPAVLPPGAPFQPGGSEDCLFLNVWAPEKAWKLPVMVWIHGGGYGLGDGTQDMVELINSNNHSFVVVSIQYRLGAFGFLSSEDVNADGQVNAGIRDQAFALSWVKSYIAHFGGDPSRVSISGESAGGGSVMYHTIARNGTLGTSLFNNAIASSPYLVPQYLYNGNVSNTRFTNFANAAGCPASAGPPLPCLRSKTTAVLQRANYEVGQLAGSGMWYFIPVTDADEYITALPSLVLRPEHPVNGRRLLVGNNAHEGAPFVPTSIATEADLLAWLSVEFPTLASTESTRRTILAQYPLTQTMADQYTRASQIYAEAHFVCPSYWLADAFTSPSSSSNPSAKSAFHYQYSVPYASHGLDMGAVFGPAGPYRSPDVVAAMHHAWGQMVTDGEPGQGIPVWQVGRDAKQTDFDQTGGQAVVVQASWGLNVTQYMGPGLEPNIRVVDAWTWEDGRGARCEFWRGLGREIEE